MVMKSRIGYCRVCGAEREIGPYTFECLHCSIRELEKERDKALERIKELERGSGERQKLNHSLLIKVFLREGECFECKYPFEIIGITGVWK